MFLKITYQGDDKKHVKEFLKDEEFEVKNTTTIHIYHDGTISKLDYKNLDKISYIYHDKQGEAYRFILKI